MPIKSKSSVDIEWVKYANTVLAQSLCIVAQHSPLLVSYFENVSKGAFYSGALTAVCCILENLPDSSTSEAMLNEFNSTMREISITVAEELHKAKVRAAEFDAN